MASIKIETGGRTQIRVALERLDMRKKIVAIGLILLALPAIFFILRTGDGGFPSGEPRFPILERFPILRIFPFIPGIVLTVLGVILQPSKKKDDDFKMNY